jgi:hypothetical protein
VSHKATDVSIVSSLYASVGHLAGFLEQVEVCLRTVESHGYSAEAIIVSNSPEKRERSILSAAFDTPWWRDHGQLLVVERETLYASWNRGVRASSGSVVTFWNVDDCRDPLAIVEGIELVRGGDSVVRLPYMVIIERSVSPRETKRVAEIRDAENDDALDPEVDFCLGPFFIFARRVFDDLGPFDEQFHIVGDFDWQLRVVPHAGLVWGQRLGGAFYADDTSLSNSGSQRLLVEHNVLTRRYEMDRPLLPLDHRGEGLLSAYRVSQMAADGCTDDWSYDRQWHRRKTWSRIYRRCRRIVGTPIRLARRWRRASR